MRKILAGKEPNPGRGFWLLSTLFALGLAPAPAWGQSQQVDEFAPPKKVLMVFSESRDLPGNAMMEQAMKAEMVRTSTNRIDFFVENLDSGRFSDEAHARAFRQYLRQKYKGQHLDLVVALMARNFSLTNELAGPMFAEVPVVFVAISELAVPAALQQSGYSGIVQRLDIAGTLSLIFRLQPETHRVVVLGGISAMDQLTLERVEKAAQGLEGIEFEFWTNRPLAQMGAGLANLPSGTAIFLSTVQCDLANQPYYNFQVAQMIVPIAKAPVYGLGSGLIGSGVVGGAMVDNESLGTRAGQLATERLQGPTGQPVPVEIRTFGTPMVDWRALKTWGIDPQRLPANCVVRYKPASVWEDYQGVILTTLAVLLAQALTIAGLLIHRRQRQRAEARARANQEARALVAAIVESSDDAIIRRDLAGRILTWNRSAERLFGYTAGEAIGQSIALILPPGQKAEEPELLEPFRRHNYETVRRHKQGYLVQVSIVISPVFDETGQLAGTSKICRDISDLKAAEREIRRQRDELAHVSRVSTLGQLTAALTHELNQPLGAILRNAEAAELFLQSEPPDLPEVRAILADIRKDDQRAGQVIERMRSLLKRRSLVADPLDLGEVVVDTLALVRSDLTARGARVNLTIPEQLPPVPGDRVHLQQVLLNLILNGVEAMSHLPEAERELCVTVHPPVDGTLAVSVCDGGMGLSTQELRQLFAPFFTTKPNGMGMGLAISRTIIEAHGGKIRAENNLDGGATFTFNLPTGAS